MGSAAIALYMSDVTVKINDKLNRMQQKEKELMAIQTESFTSTVSHEMRTPISTLLFFVRLIMNIFDKTPFVEGSIPQCVNYCTIMMSQLELLQSFIEDLLDLR
jgi:signal transduction histidine kinase